MLNEEAENRSYKVSTNSSSTMSDISLSGSRYSKSRPDLAVFHPTKHCGFTIIQDENHDHKDDVIEVAVSESKMKEASSVSQITSRNGKDCSRSHRISCTEMFRMSSRVYKLEMDFTKKKSLFHFKGQVTITDALTYLFSTMG